MEKDKDCGVTSVGDAMRHWSTVASLLALTENKDCRDLFIELDGLSYIDRWLKDALEFSTDASNSYVEEILQSLEALEKLEIGKETLISSGLDLTVRGLAGHQNISIQNKAKALLENRKLNATVGLVSEDGDSSTTEGMLTVLPTGVTYILDARGVLMNYTPILAQEKPSRGDQSSSTDATENGITDADAIVFNLNSAENGEASGETSPKRSEKLSFDLNLMSEEKDVPFSPSLNPAVMRNFDLNDSLNFGDASVLFPNFPSSSQLNSHGEPSDDSVVSIMGAKVRRSTSIQEPPFNLFNGPRGPPLAQYPPSIYNYNENAVRPAMSFSPNVYGPRGSTTYILDPRGVSLVPQLMRPVRPSYAYPAGYTPNMVAPLLSGITSSRPQLALNPGFVDEGNPRVNAGGLSQFFSGQGRPAELQQQQQALFPGTGSASRKRKVPAGGRKFQKRPPY